MKRLYEMPEKAEGESNHDWCERAAKSIPAAALLNSIVQTLDYEEAHSRNGRAAWSALGRLTGHGSGVSWAIANLYRNWKPGGEW